MEHSGPAGNGSSLPLCCLTDFLILSPGLPLWRVIPILELTSFRAFPFPFNRFQKPILQPLCSHMHAGMGRVYTPILQRSDLQTATGLSHSRSHATSLPPPFLFSKSLACNTQALKYYSYLNSKLR